jgi:hypothetical protein
MSTALKWKLVAGFLLVFVAGAMTGGFICTSTARHRFLGPPYTGTLAHRMGERLRSDLKLTPDQFAKISPIIDETARNLETIRTETTQRVRRTMAEAHEQMQPILSAEQQARLRRLEEEHRQHSRQREFPSSHPSP